MDLLLELLFKRESEPITRTDGEVTAKLIQAMHLFSIIQQKCRRQRKDLELPSIEFISTFMKWSRLLRQAVLSVYSHTKFKCFHLVQVFGSLWSEAEHSCLQCLLTLKQDCKQEDITSLDQEHQTRLAGVNSLT